MTLNCSHQYAFTLGLYFHQVLSRKYRYSIDDSQEMLSYGLGHIVCAFFNSFTGNQAPPRTLVHEGTNGKSQVASIISAFLVLMVCLFIGQYIEVRYIQ